MKCFRKLIVPALVAALSLASPLATSRPVSADTLSVTASAPQIVASGSNLYLRQNGKNVTSSSTRIVTVAGKRYIVNKKGKVLTNFVTIGTATWYADKETGAIAETYVGLAAKNGTDDYYFVRRGLWDPNFTGIAKLGKTYYFVRKGVRDMTYTGMAKNAYNGKYYYVNNGVLDKSYTGITNYWKNNKFYYIKKGRKNTSLTGLVEMYGPDNYLYMKKGVSANSYSGYVTFQKKKYFVLNGWVTSYNKGLISNCGNDEKGNSIGGKAGDQTGSEWSVNRWTGWQNCVLRHPDKKVRDLLAKLATEAASNNKIGYDQGQRWTFWIELQRSGYRPSKIKTACETDCSAGVISLVRAVGHLKGNMALKNIGGTYTGDMRSAFQAAGFKVLTKKKYRTSSDYLQAGDILLNDTYHAAICVTKGSKA